jgi:hypothetical protein
MTMEEIDELGIDEAGKDFLRKLVVLVEQEWGCG